MPRGGELDHNTPCPDGPTAAENLTGFCTGHHGGKHQAPGRAYDLAPDGTLTVSSRAMAGLATTGRLRRASKGCQRLCSRRLPSSGTATAVTSPTASSRAGCNASLGPSPHSV